MNAVARHNAAGSVEEVETSVEERPFLPFHRPNIDQEEIDAVVDTLRSGWLTMGPKTRAAPWIDQEAAARAAKIARSDYQWR